MQASDSTIGAQLMVIVMLWWLCDISIKIIIIILIISINKNIIVIIIINQLRAAPITTQISIKANNMCKAYGLALVWLRDAQTIAQTSLKRYDVLMLNEWFGQALVWLKRAQTIAQTIAYNIPYWLKIQIKHQSTPQCFQTCFEESRVEVRFLGHLS